MLVWPGQITMTLLPSDRRRCNDAAAQSLSEREQKHDRNHAPTDAKHGERRAHAIATQRRPTLLDQFS